MIEIFYIDFIPAILYLINLMSDKPNKKNLPRINTLCFLAIVASFFLMAAQDSENAVYCVGSMVLLATMLFMGHLKQMIIKHEENQKQL
jgi:uncharacterized membrane protein